MHVIRNKWGLSLTSRKISITLVLLLALIGAAYCAWGYAFSSETWRYKVTINVDTPEGLKTGYAVREVTIGTMTGRYGPESGRPVDPKGEAVVVDLGKRGVLFGLTHFDDYQTMFKIFPDQRISPKNSNEKAILEISDYPKLVTFTNTEDPKSVTQVLILKSDNKYPPKYSIEEDRFEALFGRGVTLRSIEMEMTNDSVTHGRVDKYLPSSFKKDVVKNWRNLSMEERNRLIDLITFKIGE